MPDRQASFLLAIQNEIMSQNLYTFLANSFQSNPAVRETFLRLVPMESMHEQKLRAAFHREFPVAQLTVDPSLSHVIDPMEISDPIKVIDFAITREVIAHDIYSKMAASAEPALAAFFNELAAEEADHKTVLETDILRLDGLLTWYHPSELDGFMAF